MEVYDRLIDTRWFDALADVAPPGSPLAKLAEGARAIVDLDAEDFEEIASRFDVGSELAACAVPRDPRAPQRGALGSLRPLFGLMLEVLEVRASRDEALGVLMCGHLMGEFLPHLAWETAFGHAVDPAQMRRSTGDKWGTESKECPHSSAMRAAAARSLTACDGDAEAYRTYLERFHSRTGQALSMCAMNVRASTPGKRPDAGTMCPKPCSWALRGSDDEQADLDARVRLARLFQESTFVALRHHAPVGHFFAVPNMSQVRAAWTQTWQELTAGWQDRANPLRGANPSPKEALPGFATMVSAVAGVRIERSTLIPRVAEQLSRVGNTGGGIGVSSGVQGKESHA